MRYLCVLFGLIQWRQTDGAPSGRSVSALQDICDRFPWISSCQAKDMAPPVTTSPVDAFLLGNPLPEAQQGPTDYCKKYVSNFNSYCDGRSKDGVITNFCHVYKKKCLAYQEGDAPTYTTAAPTVQVTPTLEEIKHYCSLYKIDYANLCINNQIAADAKVFCSGYNNICPGSLDPGTINPVNRGQSRKRPSSRPNGSQSGPDPMQQPSTGNSFVDGDVGGALGIPSGGGGPAEGIGGLNNMHIPNFGGPVDGGLGFGRSVFAPFFGGNKGFNVVPTKSFTQGEKYNFAGMSAGGTSGVDWSGTPGLNLINGGSGGLGGLPGFGRKKR